MYVVYNQQNVLTVEFVSVETLTWSPCVPCQRLKVCRGGTATGKRRETASVKCAGCEGRGFMAGPGQRRPEVSTDSIQTRCSSCASVELRIYRSGRKIGNSGDPEVVARRQLWTLVGLRGRGLPITRLRSAKSWQGDGKTKQKQRQKSFLKGTE